jgi:hypothetical protein
MYKKLIPMLLTCFLLVGCNFPWPEGARVPRGDKGSSEQSDSEKKKVFGEIEGEFEFPEVPLMDEAGEVRAPYKFRIDGVDGEVPAGTRAKFKMSASGKTTTSSLTAIASTWKLNSAPVQLFVFGGLMVAAGTVLTFFGMWKLGMGVGAGGASLIACGVVINEFPWVILVVIGVGLLAAGYYIYTEVKKKKLSGENKDTNFVLEELVDAVSKLPNEVLEEYIKKPLREHDDSTLIREITRKARLRK